MFELDLKLEEEMHSIITELIKTKSVNPAGNEMDIVKLILSYFEGYEIKSKIFDHGDNRGSLVIEIPGENNNSAIAFIGHIDTVPVGNEKEWKYPPFSAFKDGNYIYGRGSSDMKGGVCSMILAAKHFIKNNITPPKKLYFCFTADEEKDGTGMLTIKNSHILDNVDEVIITEPSCLKLGVCEKGALWLNIKVKGKQSHSSMPHLGLNAVEILIKYLDKLKSTIDICKKNEYLGNSTMAVTKIKGGLETNIIPPFAEASVDIRTIPGISNSCIIENAYKLAEDFMKEEKTDIVINVKNDRPSLEVDEKSELLSKMKNVYLELKYNFEKKGLCFYTDASQIIPELKVPFVILGPGDDSLAHQNNERIDVEEIFKAGLIYVNYILKS